MFILLKFIFAAALIFHSSGATADQPQTVDNLPKGAVRLPSGLIVPPPRKQNSHDPLYVR